MSEHIEALTGFRNFAVLSLNGHLRMLEPGKKIPKKRTEKIHSGYLSGQSLGCGRKSPAPTVAIFMGFYCCFQLFS